MSIQIGRISLGAVLTIVVAVVPAAAADKSPDVGIGYQFQRFSGGGSGENIPLGFNFDVSIPVGGDLSVVGQVDWSHKNISQTFGSTSVDASENFTFVGGGVRWSGRANPAVTPFVQVLGGAARSSASGSVGSMSTGSLSETDGMVQVGGGVAVPFTTKVSGLGQIDYRRIFAPGQGVSSIRFVVGVRVLVR